MKSSALLKLRITKKKKKNRKIRTGKISRLLYTFESQVKMYSIHLGGVKILIRQKDINKVGHPGWN